MKNEIIIFENQNVKLEVNMKDETVWLNREQMAKLFDRDVKTIGKHINNALNEELKDEVVVAKFATTTKHGAIEGKTQTKEVEYYNLDMIISIGYRVNSKKAVKFRQWANKIIKEYMVKGFALDDDRFLKGGKVNRQYFDELLERIKVIRTSERMAYQKITDLFIATSIDYDKKSEEAYTFFKIVQNKLHYAITGHTAAELIYNRVNAEKENMGLTTWKEAPDGMIYKYYVSIAKNYLNEEELKKLNNLTNFFLDYAESMAEENQVMTMKDWINETDNLLKFRKKEILKDSGKISHKQAVEKAEKEYEKYRVKQDMQYISSMDEMYQRYLKENNNK